MKFFNIFFLCLIIFIPIIQPVFAINDYGEDEDYLGQVVDDYENADNIAAMIDTINNETLDCMELNYTGFSEIPENMTAYTEQDEGAGITIVNDTYVDMIITRSDNRYIWFDFGVNGLQNYKIYGKLRQDYHNANAFVALMMMSNFNGNEKEHRDNSEDHTWLTISGTYGKMCFYEYDSGSYYTMTSETIVPDDTFYWFILEKIGADVYLDVYTSEVLRNAEGNGDFYDDNLTLQHDYSFRYFYLGNSYDDGTTVVGNWELYDVGFIMEGYDDTGTYYTINVLDGDPALAILYNLTIPTGGGATMEFSTDNFTWVDHNNQAGSDTLIAGYEALDLRDIYNGTIYRRVNMTSDGSDTPRMWQERFVAVTEVDAGDTYVTGSIGIFLIALIIIAPIIYYLVRKR